MTVAKFCSNRMAPGLRPAPFGRIAASPRASPYIKLAVVSSVFVSHAATDAGTAAAIGRRLRNAGYGPVFISSEPDHGIDAGRLWERELYEQLRSKRIVVFVCTPASIGSRWCFAELALARSLQKPIFPLAVKGSAPHPLLSDVQHQAFDPSSEDPCAALLESMRNAGLQPREHEAWDPMRAPYPGLASFTSSDAAVFFGREAETTKLERRLQRRLLDEEPRCVVVVGASGSGKSSLLHAGVIPALQRQRERWLVLPPMIPGARPFSSLAYSIASAMGEVPVRLEAGAAELARIVVELALRAGLRAPTPGVLLVIDQLEELFTQSSNRDRAMFVGTIADVLADPGSPLWVLASLRSEFVPRALAESSLVPLLQRQMPLGPLDAAGLRSVIRGPADVAGLSFEPELVETMVADTTGEDALPLLAFTLEKLYAQRDGPRPISRQDYARIGGVDGALRAQADMATVELAEAGVPLSEVLEALEALVLLGPDNEPVRHRVPLDDLSPRRCSILDAFVDARLLSTATVNGRASIAVAHEALLRAWPPLADAIAEHLERLHARSQIERAGREWEENGRSHAYLITGERLQRAVQWLAGEPNATSLQRDFIQASERRDEATLRREAEQLANTVLAGFPSDPELGILLAIAAVEDYAQPPRVTRALVAALAASRVRQVIELGARVMSLSWSPDGARLAVGTDAEVAIWDIERRTWWRRIEQAGARGVAFSRDGGDLAVACSDGTARVYDPTTSSETHVFRGHSAPVTCVTWVPNGSALLTGSEDRTLRLWPLTSDAAPTTLEGHRSDIESVDVSPNGQHAVSASADGRAVVWDLKSRKIIRDLQIHPHQPGFEEEVREAAYSPQGHYFATAGMDYHLAVWEFNAEESAYKFQGHPGTWCIAWAPSGREIVSGGSDAVARIWGLGNAVARTELVGHGSGVSSVAWDPTGALIASAAGEGVRVWHAPEEAAEQALEAYNERAHVLGWSPAENKLLTTSNSGIVRLWEGEPLTCRTAWPVAAKELDTPAGSASWSPDGSRVLTVGGGVVTVRSASGDDILASDAYMRQAVWSPNGRDIATVDAEGHLRIFAATADSFRIADMPHYMRVNTVRWSADGKRLVTANSDLAARVLDVATGAKLLEWNSADGRVQDALESPDGRRIAVVPYSAIAFVVNGTRAVALEGHTKLIHGAAWSPEEHRLATWSADGTCRIWEPDSRASTLELRHDAQVFKAAWSPNGDRLLTTSGDGTARIWDAGSGSELATLRHAKNKWSGWVVRGAWSRDGRRVATNDHFRCLIWDATTNPSELISTARQRVFRELKTHERTRFGLPPV